jgi:glycolate oxidase iron-sulfur subunit
MRTGFNDSQRADPRIQAADGILRSCVHCGFCAPACPTYRLTGDELDGPRGRIWLIRDLLEAGADTATAPPPDPGVVTHLDRCIGCLACMPACPSGVDYRSLIAIARDVVEERVRRGPWQQWLRVFLGRVLPNPRLFAILMRMIRPLVPLRHLVGGTVGAGLALAAGGTVRSERVAPGVYPPPGSPRGRVAMITGCAQSVLAPEINGALIRILNRVGIEAVVLKDAACCGALNEHLGQGAATRDHARKVIAEVIAEADGAGLDAVISTASGCGTLMKAYGGLFAGDAASKAPALRVAGLVRDAGEFLDRLGLSYPPSAPVRRIAWQAPCSLANGQGAAGLSAGLLRGAGFEVVAPAEGPICCGSAGTYNLTEPETASLLGAEKANALNHLAADAVASSNLGCMMQLAPRLEAPVVHIVELIDWAQGGPAPRALRGVARIG